MCWKLYCKAAKICHQLEAVRYVGFEIKLEKTRYIWFSNSDIKPGEAGRVAPHRNRIKHSSDLLIKSTTKTSQIQNTPNVNLPCFVPRQCLSWIHVLLAYNFMVFWHEKLICVVGCGRPAFSSSSKQRRASCWAKAAWPAYCRSLFYLVKHLLQS